MTDRTTTVRRIGALAPLVPTEGPQAAVLADALTERLTKVAYATEFLDVRKDILALIERDRTRWLDNIAVCQLLAKARADLAARGAPDRPRR